MANVIFLAGEAFPEETMCKVRNTFLVKAKEQNINLFDVGDGLVYAREQITKAISNSTNRNEPCVLVFCSWLDEGFVNYLIQQISHLPIVLVGFDGPGELISISGILSTSSNLIRLRVPAVKVIGNIDDKNFWNKLSYAIKAAKTVIKLRSVRIGLIGNACPGMQGTICSKTELQAIGPEVVNLGISEIMEQAKQQFNTSEANFLLKKESEFLADECTEYSLRLAISLYLAIKQKIKELSLNAVAIQCWPEMPDIYKTSPCYAISCLEDEGYVATCEADITSATTQLVLKNLSSSATFIGDIAGYNSENNSLYLWHTGAVPRSLAGTKVVLRTPSALGNGVTVECNLKKGALTVAKIPRPLEGRFRLFVAKGESISGPKEEGSNLYIKMKSPIDKVIGSLQDNYIEHHLVVSYDQLTQPLLYFSEFLQIPFISPD